MKAIRYYAAFACLALPAVLMGALVLAVSLYKAGDITTETVNRISYADLVEAGGEVTTDFYLVPPMTVMYLQCVRIGSPAVGSSKPGGGLSYCKWRRATREDMRGEIEREKSQAPGGGPEA